MNKVLKTLHHQGKIWSADQVQNVVETIDSGYPELNKNLHGGLPRYGVIEVQTINGIGELRLFLPYLLNLLQAESSQDQQTRQMVFIAPPAQINALMLLQASIPLENLLIIASQKPEESLWAAEQCLKSGCCFAVLLWQQLLAVHQLKRLKQAATTGNAVQIIFRSPHSIDLALPVSLSLGLEAQPTGLKIQVKKQLGGWPCSPFVLDMRKQWPSLAGTNNYSDESAGVMDHVVVPLASRQRVGNVVPKPVFKPDKQQTRIN
ncbi:MAG: translesion DNA synthesis-associated protein ImuA [Cognaticolwellia sp.]